MDVLTEAEMQALQEGKDSQDNEGGESTPADTDKAPQAGGEGGGEAEPPEDEESVLTVKDLDELPEDAIKVVRTKDGKYEIPYDVLKALRDENKALKDIAAQQRLAEEKAKKVEEKPQRNVITDDETGERYVGISEATIDELVAARKEALEEGNYELVNNIDVEIQSRRIMEAESVRLFREAEAEFARANEWYGKDPILTKLAREIFTDLTKDPAFADKSLKEGWDEVSRRVSNYLPKQAAVNEEELRSRLEKELTLNITKRLMKQFGITPTPDEEVNLSLSAMPQNATADDLNRFQRLDALMESDPVAYEEAVSKMSPKDYKAYLRHNAG